MLKMRRIAAGSLYLWKREMNITGIAPFSSWPEKTNRQILTPTDDVASKAKRQIAVTPLTEKSSIFEKLQCLITETLDSIMREEEKKGVSVTKADLVGWAEQLDKDGKYEYALEIFEWMEKKKRVFAPSELALFVDLLAKTNAKTKGLCAAEEYLKKVDPDFDENDPDAKNWPAFRNICRHLIEGDKKYKDLETIPKWLSQAPGCQQQLSNPVYTLADVAELVGPSVVDLFLEEGFYGDSCSTSGGSGFLIDEETIITCHHVVVNKEWLHEPSYRDAEKQVQVTLHDDIRIMGVVSESDERNDLAVVKINLADVKKSSYSLAKLGVSRRVRQGDLVFAMGSPCGYQNSLTAGVISHLNRTGYEVDVKAKNIELFQTDCAINLGSSGGPLLNMNGEVIAVVNAIKNEEYDGSRVEGIGYAIPIDTVCSVLKLR